MRGNRDNKEQGKAPREETKKRNITTGDKEQQEQIARNKLIKAARGSGRRGKDGRQRSILEGTMRTESGRKEKQRYKRRERDR